MKHRRVLVESIELSDQLSLVNVGSLKKLQSLQKQDEVLIETPNSMWLLQGLTAYRHIKPHSMPRILHTNDLQLSPDHASGHACISCEELLRFAVENNLSIFETETSYILPGEVTLTAKKVSSK